MWDFYLFRQESTDAFYESDRLRVVFTPGKHAEDCNFGQKPPGCRERRVFTRAKPKVANSLKISKGIPGFKGRENGILFTAFKASRKTLPSPLSHTVLPSPKALAPGHRYNVATGHCLESCRELFHCARLGGGGRLINFTPGLNK